MLRALLLFVTTFPLPQFSGLATTDDGSQLYFSLSAQLRGTTNENAYRKIFRYDSSGLHFFAQKDRIAVAAGIMRPTSNPYSLTSAYVSGNGSVVGYVGAADCPDGLCSYQGLLQTTLQFEGALFPTTVPYGCALSKNAQYAMCITGGSEPAQQQYSVFNLFASIEKPIYSPVCSGTESPGNITFDGHVLCGDTLWSSSGFVKVHTQGGFFNEAISDDGSRIVAQTGTSLSFYDVATGMQSSPLTLPGSQFASPISISKDGSSVLFLYINQDTLRLSGGEQLAYIHADGTGFRELATDSSGVISAVLSGDGSTAYATTFTGKLFKIDIASGVSTLIANATEIQLVHGGAVAGSIYWILGTGLADATVAASTFPLGTSLGGAQVTINGTPVPQLSVSPTFISFQIPWETPLGSATIAVVRPSSTFTQTAPPPLQIQAIQPVLALNEVISQDFSAIITSTNPANPGDVVNFYLTGLGPVTVPVADGALSPSSPLPLLVNPVTVSASSPVKVVYAGLAPGLVGFYQLSVQMPQLVKRPPMLPNAVAVEFLMTVNSLDLPPVWVRPNQ